MDQSRSLTDASSVLIVARRENLSTEIRRRFLLELEELGQRSEVAISNEHTI